MRLAFTACYLLAAVISAVAAIVLLRRRQVPGGIWLALMIVAAGFWALCDAIEVQLATVDAKRLISQIQYAGVVTPAPLFFHAAFALARLQKRIGHVTLAGIWVIPLITLLAAWTSGWHNWLWTNISIPDPETNLGVYEYGWWFWVFSLHGYALLAIATGAILWAARQVTRPFRAPLGTVALAVFLPWMGNIAYVAKLGPIPGLNWFSISVILSGCLLAWLVRRAGLLDLLPHAREALVAAMQDGVIVVDSAGRILYSNAAALGYLWPEGPPEYVPRELLEPPAETAAAPLDPSTRAQYENHPWEREVSLDVQAETRWFELRVAPVRDRWNEIAARLIVIRDITGRKQMESQRESLLAELQDLLGVVQTLEGMLPICSGCKSVREDDGSWSPLDHYVRNQTGVKFSHGLCPTCMARLYGDIPD